MLSVSLRSVLVGVLLSLCLSVFAFGGLARADFGFLPGGAGFDAVVANQDGSTDTQAGSHPYAVTVGFTMNQKPDSEGSMEPDGRVKDLRVDVPAGFVGDPSAVARCTQEQFVAPAGISGGSTCPDGSAIGVVALHFLINGFPATLHQAVYNLVPPQGVPAEFGFDVVQGIVVRLYASVRTGEDYGVTLRIPDISTFLPFVGTSMTLWGVPGDAVHDGERGHCEGISGPTGELCPNGFAVRPFLTNPTGCSGPVATLIHADSWQQPGAFLLDSSVSHDAQGTPVGIDGCNQLDFSPSLAVQPDRSSTGSPSGLSVDLSVPQNSNPLGLAEAHLKRALVALPAGLTVSPSAANGLGACTPGEIGLDNAEPVRCPDSAKIGSVEIDTPLLASPLEGSVYVAQQQNNPFGSLLALYLVAEGEGVLIKVPGEVRLDPVTGQITTVFDNLPQQPFSDVKLHFFDGPRAALMTPTGCGTYTTTSQLTPYSNPSAVEPLSSFQVDAGCQSTFGPSLAAGTTSNQAGGFSPFSVTISRGDQDQNLAGVTVKAPPGLSAILKGVERCGEPQAGQGACGPNSLIGHTTVAAGPGPDPVWVQGGQVFLTGPYKGAPFGLSIVMPAKAGPFDLGTVVVRAAVSIDPHTAQVTIISDPLPTILQGVPLDLKTVNVTVDRPGFVFNPTSCEPLSVGGTIVSTQGASAGVSSRFQAAGCQGLGFHPSFKVSTQAKTSKANGASLDVKVTSAPGQANIGKTVVSLPKQLPARLSTIQHACPEATFAANPASCPAASAIGTGRASTPILGAPVTGPAYLVSHGGAAFPDVVVILQGEGVTVDLTGAIDIKHGITTASFNNVPDVPIGSFELITPEGPHSGLAANLPAKAKGSMCGQSLTMPTTITAQNGAQIKQNTKIAVTGCPKAKKKPKHKRAKGKPKRKGK